MRKIIALSVFVLVSSLLRAETAVPAVGAQVFIEPGQTAEQIDRWFALLEENGFTCARIRMFGSHLMSPDGGWDFSLYDQAFEAAGRHHVRLFATLFPPTDELNDVGGFKFPRDEQHLEEVGRYVDGVVSHFKDFPALDTWVLQNEPGTGSQAVKPTPLSKRIRAQWEAARPAAERDGFLSADFSEQAFLVYYTTWYLGWIAARVQALDPVHGRHINPHQILDTLPEYDFDALSPWITSLGSSMHFSWHFQSFSRREYPLGVSVMADLIRAGARGKPFWVTEFQGGAVTASGYEVLCPTPEEVTQSLWTAYAAGASGLMFWTLNPRKAVREAGEWGLLNYFDEPSDRMQAAAAVAACVREREALLSEAKPLGSAVTILYNNESLWMQKEQAADKDAMDGRGPRAVINSVAAAYAAFAALGEIPGVETLDRYDWSSPEGKVVLLPHILCLPERYLPVVEAFVNGGGTVVATGLTGYYDENMRCTWMGPWAWSSLFGAAVEDIRIPGPRYASLPGRLMTNYWQGRLRLSDAEPLLQDGSGVYGCRRRIGRGQVIWVPSLIDLGSKQGDGKELAAFYREVIPAPTGSPFRLSRPCPGLLVRRMQAGDDLLCVVVNKSGRALHLKMDREHRAPETIFRSGSGKTGRRALRIGPEETVVLLWKDTIPAKQ